ncbi:MAG: Hsp20/alpha crystallin family protein [Candidatus Caenarcaniphilales bacterium]|nr:Hsp20/alpha crystallin family protein [Candidatus Caenarcaniphilales bacterium]
MSLTLWDPLHEIEELLNKYRKTSRGLIPGLPVTNQTALEAGDWIPPVEIEELDNEYILRLELPGVEKKDITLNVENSMLIIKGEKRSRIEQNDSKVHRSEFSIGYFTRTFSLPPGIKTDKIPDAEFQDGILKLTLLKTEESKPKQIDIKIK